MKLLEAAKQAVTLMGFTPAAASFEDETGVWAFSVESLGPGTYGHPKLTIHYCKWAGKWDEQTERLLRGKTWTPEQAERLHDLIGQGTLPH